MKISQMPLSTTPSSDDVLAMLEGGTQNKKITFGAVAEWIANEEEIESFNTNSKTIVGAINELNDDSDEFAHDIKELEHSIDELVAGTKFKRYGVSGVGQQIHTLTRLHDSVGMTAQVGTDGDNSNVVNDFDNAAPFMRRKCVGEWSLVDNVATFHVNAYQGDANYTEDGTMGDYVAVECPRCYYYFEDGTLIISAYQYPDYRPFDIFCRNHDINNTIPYYYAPAYALVIDEDGHAVSLPGYDNEQDSYKPLVDAARTYKNGSLGQKAILMPAAFNFYEWALYTVEFATTQCQSVMQGCSALRHSNDDRLTFVDSTHVLVSNYYASRVVGEYIAIIPTNVDINAYQYKATHKILSSTMADSTGAASDSGTYQLLEVENLGKNYFEYDLTGATEYRIAGRPYRTGECNGVSTPSGSPVSNTNGYYPMKYRWRENVFGNQFTTAMDLFAERVGTGDDDYTVDWYYLPDPTSYEPSATSNPDAAELAASPFVKLDVSTPHENYVNGYIKSKEYSDTYPDIWIPGETTGGSATTYFADYASLVHSTVVRGVRFGGNWSSGGYAGFSSCSASRAVSLATALFGGGLFLAQ